MSLSKKLILLILAFCIALGLIGFFSLQTLKNNLIESRKHEIQSVLTFARNQSLAYINKAEQGVITKEEAETHVVTLLSAMREGASYIWANGGDDAVAKVHPREGVVGTFQDSYAKDIEKLKTIDFGFRVGVNTKPGTDERVTKVNGYTKIPKWDWVIGIGVYMDDLNSVYWQAATNFIILASIILAVVIGLAVFIARGIMITIGGEPNYAAKVTHLISDGYLNEKIEGSYSEQSLLGSIAKMQQSLQAMVKSIQEGSARLTESTQELNGQMTNITDASQKSTDASHSTASALQELSTCIDDIANSARRTEENSEDSAKKCSEGDKLVQQSANDISDISEKIMQSTQDIEQLQKRSSEIGNIVNVIKDIAEQTNLLALNAAIEAARAGEQGRGFAVVADEVRTLASRTATATAEITETINVVQSETDNVAKAIQSILPKVETSVSSSKDVTVMLGEIEKGSLDTMSMVKEVSHATGEQSQVADEISQHFEQISTMISETSEAVEKCNENVSVLDKLAIELHDTVRIFKV